MFKFLASAVIAVLLAACTTGAGSAFSGASGKTLIIEAPVWAAYEEYLARISGTNPGTFVVQIVGDHAVSQAYGYCGDGNCRTSTFINSVFDDCRAKGLTCAIFARSSTIELNYKLEQ
jgi:hypothetical protein